MANDDCFEQKKIKVRAAAVGAGIPIGDGEFEMPPGLWEGYAADALDGYYGADEKEKVEKEAVDGGYEAMCEARSRGVPLEDVIA